MSAVSIFWWTASSQAFWRVQGIFLDLTGHVFQQLRGKMEVLKERLGIKMSTSPRPRSPSATASSSAFSLLLCLIREPGWSLASGVIDLSGGWSNFRWKSSWATFKILVRFAGWSVSSSRRRNLLPSPFPAFETSLLSTTYKNHSSLPFMITILQHVKFAPSFIFLMRMQFHIEHYCNCNLCHKRFKHANVCMIVKKQTTKRMNKTTQDKLTDYLN